MLLEMASLDKGKSAAGFLREMLDQVTPLLRSTVAAMRAAAQEQDNARQELQGMLSEIHALMGQRDLLDAPPARAQRTAATSGARTQRTARRGRRQS